jgi:O-antigen/teichoic acid export membrane protein
MNLARSSFKLFVANLGSAAITFLGITYFARELGPSQMGVFFLFQALLGMLVILADFGLRGAVEKRISEGESQGAYLSSAIVLKVLPIAIIVLGILLLQSFIHDYVGANVSVPLAVAVVLQEVALLSTAVLKGELRVGETAILKFARKATWAGVGTAFVIQDFGAVGLIYAVLAGQSVMLIWGWYKTSVPPTRPSMERARSLFDYGKYNVVSSVSGYFYSWMDIAIIGFFLTQAHVGAYEIAWRVTAIVMLLSKSIATAVFPQVSRWDADNVESRIESTIRETITPSIALVIPAFFGAVLFSREILSLVFGREFTIAWLVLIILMGEKFIQAIHVILGRSLQGIDRPDLAAKASAVSILLNFVLNVVLIHEFGFIGAALATTLSFSCNSLLHYYYLSKFLTVELPSLKLVGLFLAALAMSIVLFAIQTVAVIDTLPRLIAVILVGATAYSGFSLFVPSVRATVVEHAGQLR